MFSTDQKQLVLEFFLFLYKTVCFLVFVGLKLFQSDTLILKACVCYFL